MVGFDSRTKNAKGRWVYYNPNTDIVYFGDNSCISTIIHTFQKAYKVGVGIPRIAINATDKVTKCCSWEGDGYGMERNTGVSGGCNLQQALHGIPAELRDGKLIITDCPGLKQVYFVQHLMLGQSQLAM
jgi:hypothetical protein